MARINCFQPWIYSWNDDKIIQNNYHCRLNATVYRLIQRAAGDDVCLCMQRRLLSHRCEANWRSVQLKHRIGSRLRVYYLAWRFGPCQFPSMIHLMCRVCFAFHSQDVQCIKYAKVSFRSAHRAYIIYSRVSDYSMKAFRVSSGLPHSIDFAPRVHSHTRVRAHTFPFTSIYNSWCLLIFCLIIPLKVFLCALLLCRHNYSPNGDKIVCLVCHEPQFLANSVSLLMRPPRHTGTHSQWLFCVNSRVWLHVLFPRPPKKCGTNDESSARGFCTLGQIIIIKKSLTRHAANKPRYIVHAEQIGRWNVLRALFRNIKLSKCKHCNVLCIDRVWNLPMYRLTLCACRLPVIAMCSNPSILV